MSSTRERANSRAVELTNERRLQYRAYCVRSDKFEDTHHQNGQLNSHANQAKSFSATGKSSSHSKNLISMFERMCEARAEEAQLEANSPKHHNDMSRTRPQALLSTSNRNMSSAQGTPNLPPRVRHFVPRPTSSAASVARGLARRRVVGRSVPANQNHPSPVAAAHSPPATQATLLSNEESSSHPVHTRRYARHSNLSPKRTSMDLSEQSSSPRSPSVSPATSPASSPVPLRRGESLGKFSVQPRSVAFASSPSSPGRSRNQHSGASPGGITIVPGPPPARRRRRRAASAANRNTVAHREARTHKNHETRSGVAVTHATKSYKRTASVGEMCVRGVVRSASPREKKSYLHDSSSSTSPRGPFLQRTPPARIRQGGENGNQMQVPTADRHQQLHGSAGEVDSVTTAGQKKEVTGAHLLGQPNRGLFPSVSAPSNTYEDDDNKKNEPDQGKNKSGVVRQVHSPRQRGSVSFRTSSTDRVQESTSASKLKPPSVKFNQVVAAYDMKPSDNADLLSFSRGDVILAIRQQSAQWWLGVFQGRVGLFPMPYMIAPPRGSGASSDSSSPQERTVALHGSGGNSSSAMKKRGTSGMGGSVRGQVPRVTPVNSSVMRVHEVSSGLHHRRHASSSDLNASAPNSPVRPSRVNAPSALRHARNSHANTLHVASPPSSSRSTPALPPLDSTSPPVSRRANRMPNRAAAIRISESQPKLLSIDPPKSGGHSGDSGSPSEESMDQLGSELQRSVSFGDSDEAPKSENRSHKKQPPPIAPPRSMAPERGMEPPAVSSPRSTGPPPPGLSPLPRMSSYTKRHRSASWGAVNAINGRVRRRPIMHGNPFSMGEPEDGLDDGIIEIGDPEGKLRFRQMSHERILVGGTFNRMVEWFLIQSDEEIAQSDDLQTFLMTYRSTHSAEVLLHTIINTFADWKKRSRTNLLSNHLFWFLLEWVEQWSEWDFWHTGLFRRLIKFTSQVLPKGQANVFKLHFVRLQANTKPVGPLRPSANAKNVSFRVKDIGVNQLAEQLTLLEADLFCSIQPIEFAHHVAPPDGISKEVHSPYLHAISSHFNLVSLWVATEIVTARTPREQAGLWKRFIRLAKRLRELNNFNTLMQIISGLSNAATKRMKQAYALLSPKLVSQFRELESIFFPTQNFQNYRSAIQNASGPVLPYLAMYLRDLTYISDGNPTYLPVEDGDASLLLSWDKMRLFYAHVQRLLAYFPDGRNPYASSIQLDTQLRDYLLTLKALDNDNLYNHSRIMNPIVVPEVGQEKVSDLSRSPRKTPWSQQRKSPRKSLRSRSKSPRRSHASVNPKARTRAGTVDAHMPERVVRNPLFGKRNPLTHASHSPSHLRTQKRSVSIDDKIMKSKN